MIKKVNNKIKIFLFFIFVCLSLVLTNIDCQRLTFNDCEDKKELKINNVKSASKNEGPDIDFDDENDDGVTLLSLKDNN